MPSSRSPPTVEYEEVAMAQIAQSSYRSSSSAGTTGSRQAETGRSLQEAVVSGGNVGDGSHNNNNNNNNNNGMISAEEEEARELYRRLSSTRAEGWEPVREWLSTAVAALSSSSSSSSSNVDIPTSSVQGRTPLHEACNVPGTPVDVVVGLLQLYGGERVASSVDHNSWIPLHYACSNGLSLEVLRALLEAFPEGASRQDRRGRTPLHFWMAKAAVPPAKPLRSSLLLGRKASEHRRRRRRRQSGLASQQHLMSNRSGNLSNVENNNNNNNDEDEQQQQQQQQQQPSTTVMMREVEEEDEHVNNDGPLCIRLLCSPLRRMDPTNNNNNGQNMMPVNPASIPDYQSRMIPLHYACAYGASNEATAALVRAWPEGVWSRDHKGRTPLHLSMSNAHAKEAAERIATLCAATPPPPSSSSSSSQQPPPQPTSETSTMMQARVVDAQDHDGNLPLDSLATKATSLTERGRRRMLHQHGRSSTSYSSADNKHNQQNSLELERTRVKESLTAYLDAVPTATADFLTGLQKLPDWLRDQAVVHNVVQTILNDKISKRFPTMFLILDAYCLLFIMVFFCIASKSFLTYYDEINFDGVPRSSDHYYLFPLWRTSFNCDDVTGQPTRSLCTTFLYFGAIYFLIRELLQMLSLYSLDAFKSWTRDVTNWLDVVLICLVFYFSAAMDYCRISREFFRFGVVITVTVLSAKFISFLKSTLVEFAVFVNGVLYVVKRLGAFLVALSVILVAFSQVFFFLFYKTPYCSTNHGDDFNDNDNDNVNNNINDDDHMIPDYTPAFAHCSLPRSLLRILASLMGEVAPSDYTKKPEAIFFFALYIFTVVILLSNVLIAVVTDNYGVIKNERAAMVFWSDRLDFVAEMDAISSGPWKKRVRSLFTCDDDEDDDDNDHHRHHHSSFPTEQPRPEEENFDYEMWDRLVTSFLKSGSRQRNENWIGSFVRLVIFCTVTPLWIMLGFASAGWLWPPQVRQWMLVQRVVSVTRADVSNEISKQITELRKEVVRLRVEVRSEMKNDRMEIVAMKAEAENVQADVLADMMQIKEIMSTLLELRREEITILRGQR